MIDQQVTDGRDVKASTRNVSPSSIFKKMSTGSAATDQRRKLFSTRGKTRTLSSNVIMRNLKQANLKIKQSVCNTLGHTFQDGNNHYNYQLVFDREPKIENLRVFRELAKKSEEHAAEAKEQAEKIKNSENGMPLKNGRKGSQNPYYKRHQLFREADKRTDSKCFQPFFMTPAEFQKLPKQTEQDAIHDPASYAFDENMYAKILNYSQLDMDNYRSLF